MDLNMLVGTRWIEEIQSQLTSSQFFLVLLSAQSILSDMVRREIELAHKLSDREASHNSSHSSELCRRTPL